MKGGSFLLRCLAEIPSRMVQVLHCGMLPPHLRFALKHRQPGRDPGQCFATEMRQKGAAAADVDGEEEDPHAGGNAVGIHVAHSLRQHA